MPVYFDHACYKCCGGFFFLLKIYSAFGFQVKAIYIHCDMFSVQNGLLTPTLKAKRPELREYFKKQIEELYSVSMWSPRGALLSPVNFAAIVWSFLKERNRSDRADKERAPDLATEPFLTREVSNNIFSTITKYTLFLLNDIVASC